MALTDLEIGVFSIGLKETIRDFFSASDKNQEDSIRSNIGERSTGKLSDGSLEDFLLTVHPDSLDDKSPEGYAALPTQDKYSIIERALSTLNKDNFGLVFDNKDSAQWVRVSLVHVDRTPLSNPGDYRWIRLTSIDQVIPKVALGGGNDSRGFGWNLQVKTNGGDTFWASDRTIRGNLIQVPQRDLMCAIDAAVKAAIQPDVQPKHA